MMRVPTVNEREAEAAYAAAQKVVETHKRLVETIKVGSTLAEIDMEVARILHSLDSRSCFLNYKPARMRPFPGHSCLSVNDCIVHGHPACHTDPLEEGDILSVDIGVLHRGWIGDAAWTYAIGSVSDENKRLMDCGKEALAKGLPTLVGGRPYTDWAQTVQDIVEGDYGYHCVRHLGGHGYGKKLHAPPYVANNMPSYPGEWPDADVVAKPGTLLAVEPMVAIGTGDRKEAARTWPIYSADGSMAVHYEADVLIQNGAPRVLTEGMTDLPDIVG